MQNTCGFAQLWWVPLIPTGLLFARLPHVLLIAHISIFTRIGSGSARLGKESGIDQGIPPYLFAIHTGTVES